MAEDQQIRLYEGLFLLGQEAGADLHSGVAFVKDVLDRAEAEVIVLRKWEERKLAYSIRGQRRGTFLLALFKARGVQIANIERSCNLSDHVVRCLITRGDHLGETEIQLEADQGDLLAELALRQSEAEAAEAAEGEAEFAGSAEPSPDQDPIAPPPAPAVEAAATLPATETPEASEQTPPETSTESTATTDDESAEDESSESQAEPRPDAG